MAKERVFRTLKEIKDAYFPNRTWEELRGKQTDEEIREDLRKIMESARRNSEEINSKKVPI